MSESKVDNKKLSLDIRRAAMDLLARREHSVQELVTKLSRRFNNQVIINFQVQLLADENLQSDQRFIESFIRNRIQNCHGPLKIKFELKNRGIDGCCVDEAIEIEDPDWMTILQSLSDKKYSGVPPSDEKEKAKRIRFFQYRGFQYDHIKNIL